MSNPSVRLPFGPMYDFRRADQRDVQALAQHFRSLDAQERDARFLGAPLSDIGAALRDEVWFVAVSGTTGAVLGEARSRSADGRVAHVKLSVAEPYRHSGIGTRLGECLRADAHKRGVLAFQAVLPREHRLIRVIESLGASRLPTDSRLQCRLMLPLAPLVTAD